MHLARAGEFPAVTRPPSPWSCPTRNTRLGGRPISAPDASQRDDAALGHEVGVQRSACRDKLGFDRADVRWVRGPFNSALEPGPKVFDANLSQFSITDQRRAAVASSSPYFDVTQVVVRPLSMREGSTVGTAWASCGHAADTALTRRAGRERRTGRHGLLPSGRIDTRRRSGGRAGRRGHTVLAEALGQRPVTGLRGLC